MFSWFHRPSQNNDNINSTIEINGGQEGRDIYGVAFLEGGRSIVTGGSEGKVRHWQVEDGKERRVLMDVGEIISSIAASQDSQWIVAGTANGDLVIWSAIGHKEKKILAHTEWVHGLDISPDGSRIASGSNDNTLNVWSLSSCKRLLGPLKHDNWVTGVKFSPDSQFLATAAAWSDSVRIFSTLNGHLLVEFPIKIYLVYNHSLAWTRDSSLLYVLSNDGIIHCLNISTRTTLTKWSIHTGTPNRGGPHCIALAFNDTFIAASTDSSISFWDTVTHQQIGSVIDTSKPIILMVISENHDIAIGDSEGQLTLRSLCNILPVHYHSEKILCEWQLSLLPAPARELIGKSFQSILAQNTRANEKVINLEKTIEELRDQLAVSQSQVKEREDVHVAARLQAKEKEGTLVEIIRAYEKKDHCEMLFTGSRIYDATDSLLEITDGMSDGLRDYIPIMDWLNEFTGRCVSKLCVIGDDALSIENHHKALAAYTAALSFTSSSSSALLFNWIKIAIIGRSADDVLDAATEFNIPLFHVFRATCDVLESSDRVLEAIECFHQLQKKVTEKVDEQDERAQWESDFRRRSVEKIMLLGDAEMGSEKHDSAIEYYSIALSLDVTNYNIVVRCCEARVGLWEDALRVVDATQFDSSSYEGYQRKYLLLHKMGRHKAAFRAFQMMILAIEQSPDPKIHKLHGLYLDITPLIRKAIRSAIRDIPRVLIDTSNGRLYDKTLQAAAFEELPIFEELRSSMTTRDRLDCARIQAEVEGFYQYVMFSHKWEPPTEPTFQLLGNSSVNELPESPGNNKLRAFCNIVRSRRFRWCWSDTCCVNQGDRGVQQESVIAMFRWYRRSALTVVHLLGVSSDSEEADLLWRSIWNSRGWTYQEYIASPVVQFYTEDWKPYRGLDMWNHKESPVIREEMERATRIDTQQLTTLKPGLDNVREKLYLASRRETTREEDIAYSLFGIFGVAISVIYGEGRETAVHRLLQHILTHSDNVTLLSWTGSGSSNNSYLPADLTVYNQIAPPHVPQPIKMDEMDSMVVALRSSIPDVSPAVKLYDQLLTLPPPSLVAGRLKLPGLVFPLTNLSGPDIESGLPVYRATTPALGDIQIKTKDNLSGMKRLRLVHPWISPLLDEDFSGDMPLFDLDTRAVRLVIRLRQPFGALLLAPSGRVQHRRVATDSFIQVQINERTTLEQLTNSIQTVDVK